MGHETLGVVYFRAGRKEEALNELTLAVTMTKGDPTMEAYLAIVLALSGQKEEAEGILKKLLDLSKTTYVSDIFLGFLLFALGRHDEAFERLEIAYERRSTEFSQLEIYWWREFGDLHRDPRWASLKKRVGLS